MTLLGALVVLLHLSRHNLDFLHTFTYIPKPRPFRVKFFIHKQSTWHYLFLYKIWST